jgi:hypothetical protein
VFSLGKLLVVTLVASLAATGCEDPTPAYVYARNESTAIVTTRGSFHDGSTSEWRKVPPGESLIFATAVVEGSLVVLADAACGVKYHLAVPPGYSMVVIAADGSVRFEDIDGPLDGVEFEHLEPHVCSDL